MVVHFTKKDTGETMHKTYFYPAAGKNTNTLKEHKSSVVSDVPETRTDSGTFVCEMPRYAA